MPAVCAHGLSVSRRRLLAGFATRFGIAPWVRPRNNRPAIFFRTPPHSSKKEQNSCCFALLPNRVEKADKWLFPLPRKPGPHIVKLNNAHLQACIDARVRTVRSPPHIRDSPAHRSRHRSRDGCRSLGPFGPACSRQVHSSAPKVEIGRHEALRQDLRAPLKVAK
jgi:hypothetical protein